MSSGWPTTRCGHPTPESTSDPLARIRDAARERGLDVEVRERPEAGSLREAARLLGIPETSLVKTLVVGRSDDTFLFALIPGDRVISWPKLRAVVGVNRLRMPSADVAFEATGYERGTIVPVGSSTAWPVFADARIVGERIALGAGARGHSMFVDADALIDAYDATVADISEPAPVEP